MVRILTDHIQATQRSSKVLEMVEAGLDLRLHSKYKIEHNKFGVYDGKLVSTGSFNWTGAAARSNSENCVFLSEEASTKTFRNRFEYLWQINSAESSQGKLARIQVGMTNKSRNLSTQRKRFPK